MVVYQGYELSGFHSTLKAPGKGRKMGWWNI